MGVNGVFILPYLLQRVMIYSLGINTDLRIDPKSIPYPEKSLTSHLTSKVMIFFICWITLHLQEFQSVAIGEKK